MSNNELKALTAIIIFFIGISGGLFPLLSDRFSKAWKALHYAEYCSRGIFLGVGLIHLLPDALKAFARAEAPVTYPVVFAICAFTIFAIQFIEQIAYNKLKTREQPGDWMSYLLMTLLSVHSIITGAALGIDTHRSHIYIIFIAIIAHKGAAAFALATNMKLNKINKQAAIITLTLFSLMTPIGILFGSVINDFLTGQAVTLTKGVFGAFAAGTFLYIATYKVVDIHGSHKPPSLKSIGFFGLGVLLMTLIAFVA